MMITREEAKRFFDSDAEVLKNAYESDMEYAEITKTTISVITSKIFEILLQKGLLTENEALEHIKEVSGMLRKEVEKDV